MPARFRLTFSIKSTVALAASGRAKLRLAISISSPIARALIGKAKGDSAEVTTPKGTRSYEILKIEYK